MDITSMNGPVSLSIVCNSVVAVELCKELQNISENAIDNATHFYLEDEEYFSVNLKHLVVSGNNLHTIELFTIGFPNLIHMNVASNNLKDVSCLASLVKLQLLDVSHNQIASLSFVAELRELTILRSNHNRIENLEYLNKNDKLTQLFINHNKIPWCQYIFLSNLPNLVVLMKSNNPSDDKPKLNEFIQFLVPSLVLLDSSKVASQKDIPEFNKSMVDIKIMLTQAKLQCKLNTAAANHAEQQVQLQQQALEKTLNKNSTLRKSPSQTSISGLSESEIQSLDDASSPKSKSNKHIASTPNSKHKRNSSVGVNNGRKKQEKQSNNSTFLKSSGELLSSADLSLLVPSAENAGEGDDTTSVVGSESVRKNYVHAQSAGGRNSSRPKATKKGPKTHSGGIADDTIGSVSSTDNVNSMQSATPPTIIKFYGNHHTGSSNSNSSSNSVSDDLPVALCMYANKEGYARWSKLGAIAVSLEKRRLLASYKSGAIALVYDSGTGNGSLMDTRGRCLFVLHNNQTAKILDIKGNTISEYNNNEVNNKSDSVAGDDDTNSSTVKPHVWDIEGLIMQFDPLTWEIVVRFQNERLECSFSNKHGCTLMSEKEDVAAKKANKAAALKKASKIATTTTTSAASTTAAATVSEVNDDNSSLKTADISADNTDTSTHNTNAVATKHSNTATPAVKNKANESSTAKQQSTSVTTQSKPQAAPTTTVSADLDVTQHETLRSDLQSMNSNLDDMLAGIKGLKLR